MLSTKDIRKLFLDYFSKKGHTEVKSSSLIPADDPTLLFVNAGMVQFKDIFLGAETRTYSRAVSSQRCVRAGGKHNDLDQVGYTARHHTFFEMLGNFSFGDYFKHEAIQYAWEFLTEELKLPKEKLWVTVFDEDDEAIRIWHKEIGFPLDRITRIGAKDNFWQMGETGPCGPCSEIFYDHGENIAGGPPGAPDEDGDRFVEIWNLVFMQYDKQADGSLLPLPKPCVDTGMGLERLAAILQGKHNNYDIDLFQGLIKAAVKLTGPSDVNDPSLKVIADHIRTCAFLIADGVLPSNEGRGYVLRRIIRRAARHGHKLGAKGLFFYLMLDSLIEQMGEGYPELVKSRSQIASTLKKEEAKFAETLDLGMQEFNRLTADNSNSQIFGDVAFKLYDTYGFPLDLTEDVARENGMKVDVDGFKQLMEQQKHRSRSAKQFTQVNQLPADVVKDLQATVFLGYEKSKSTAKVLVLLVDGKQVDLIENGQKGAVILDKTPFYAESGGQVGDKGRIFSRDLLVEVNDTQKVAGQYHLHQVEVVKGSLETGQQVETEIDPTYRKKVILNHTATHLLHKVLQDKLGKHVQQKGSLVNAEKLRFDFAHEQAVSKSQIKDIENRVNQAIRANYQGIAKSMSFDQAIESGAVALFGEKYGDQVRVIDFGGFSTELCGGTHVNATGDIGTFKITQETSVASGIRRIEAITGEAASEYYQEQESLLNELTQSLNASSIGLKQAVMDLKKKNKLLESKLEKINKQKLGEQAKSTLEHVTEINGISYLTHVFENADTSLLRDYVDGFKAKYVKGVVVYGSVKENKAQLLVGVTKDLCGQIRAGDLIKRILAKIGGKGGGRPDFAQGGGDSGVEQLKQAIDVVLNQLQQ